MHRDDFAKWLAEKKVASIVMKDHISRVSRIEKVFSQIFGQGFSLEKAFRQDEGVELLSLLRKNGENPDLQKFPGIDLPVGKSTMASIRYSLRTYFRFLAECHNG